MFDAIAPRYDLLNHMLSVGIDRRWRARAIESLQLTGHETLLDICTGTADVALQARKGGHSRRTSGGGAARVIGVDFAGVMLSLGLKKVRAAGGAKQIMLVQGDATHLPIHDGSVDAVSVAFGIRNVHHLEGACAEMARVLGDGGRLAILEFGVPQLPVISALYSWYFTHLLPFVGRVVSGHHAAYSYLPASVGAFPPPAEFMATLRNAGFVDVHVDPLTFGIVCLYTATRR